ncbi:MAG: alpha/beta hydrolase [Flavobacterium sp.]|nr:MAG: alpha/beta hydrolase [Flavobacterium sp.]
MIFPYNDGTIYYDIQGEGPAVLLLHGFLEDLGMWDELAGFLLKNFTVIRLDLPGHGRSSVYHEIHSMEFMAEVAHELLQDLDLESVSLIGHSMGGYVALAFLELFPSEVRQIVLLNSSPYNDSPERLLNRKRALKLIPKNKKLFVTVSILNLFAEDRREDLASEISALQQQALTIPTEGILAAIRGMMERKDRRSVLKKFRDSKYLIAGTKDEVIPISDSERTAKETGCTLIKIESGHMTLIENVKVIHEIVHFIE